MAEEGKFRVENSNGQNYKLWKIQMEDYLYQKDCNFHDATITLNIWSKSPMNMNIPKN